jgi:hypothetical protein
MKGLSKSAMRGMDTKVRPKQRKQEIARDRASLQRQVCQDSKPLGLPENPLLLGSVVATQRGDSAQKKLVPSRMFPICGHDSCQVTVKRPSSNTLYG